MQTATEGTFNRMERMYRPQRLIYDLTRAWYLLGRDRLIDGIGAQPGERLLDIGCGTGRNLERIRECYPGVRLYGIDPSSSMLSVAERRLGSACVLERGVVEDLRGDGLFGTDARFEHVLFSYSLSIMESPTLALLKALDTLAPGGRLHIVDFGPMNGLPAWASAAMRLWLERFGVRPRPEVVALLEALAAKRCWRLDQERPHGGYCELLRLTLR